MAITWRTFLCEAYQNKKKIKKLLSCGCIYPSCWLATSQNLLEMSILCVKSQKKHWKSFKLLALCDSFTASGIPSAQRPHTVHTSGSISMKYREHCEPLRSGSLVNEHSLKSLSLLLINQLLLARPVLASKSMTALLKLGNLCMRDSKKKKKLLGRLLILLLRNFGCFH